MVIAKNLIIYSNLYYIQRQVKKFLFVK